MIEVVDPGPLCTVQDAGRPGFAHLGVPAAGPVDWLGHAVANRLVGNPPGAAALEFTGRGPTVRVDRPATVAVVGATAADRALRVAAGETVHIGPCRGLRGYLAVAGGIVVEPVLRSRSTDTLGGLGPAPLRVGDRLSTAEVVRPLPRHDPTILPDRGGVVRVVPGPHADWFSPAARTMFYGRPYTATPDHDRTGVRLAGPRLLRIRAGEVPVTGMVAGAVQVPPAGEPLVLLANHGPTGGYPVVAVVARADLPVLAQLRPGHGVRFVPVSVATARRAYAELWAAVERSVQ